MHIIKVYAKIQFVLLRTVDSLHGKYRILKEIKDHFVSGMAGDVKNNLVNSDVKNRYKIRAVQILLAYLNFAEYKDN